MKQFRNILPLAAALLVSACGGETSLPDPTGKASVRAINAIQASSTVTFRIEERSIGSIEYREISSGERFDDFSYNFNFDIQFAGEDEAARIATESIDFVADQDYTLLLSGTVAAPSVTVWESTEREFADGATVFQARFAHTSASLSADTVDIYFTPDGTAPVAGEQAATVAFGEISAPMDFEAGDYVVTITAAGDFTDVRYVSSATGIAAAGDFIITPFDGTVNEIAAVGVRILSAGGGSFEMPAPNNPSLIQFLHAAADAGDVDIYDDEALTSQVVNDLPYQTLTTEQAITDSEATYRVTPFDSTGTVLVVRDTLTRDNRRYRMIFSGSAGEYTSIMDIPDRRPVDTGARIILANESQNFELVTVYAMETGEVPDETTLALRGGLPTGFGPVDSLLADGTFDLYVTEASATDFNIIAGPIPVTVATRDIREFMIFDNVADTAIVDLVELVETP